MKITEARETILADLSHKLPEKEVAKKLADTLLMFHNRLLANQHSPYCDGRRQVVEALNKTYEELVKISEG